MMWDIYYGEELWVTLKEMKSFWGRFRGYMARNLEEVEKGLWFPDCCSIHTFFMRFPLDIYFLDVDHKVLATFPNIGRGRFLSAPGADSVVEVPAGSCSSLVVGEMFRFQKCQ